MVKIIKDKIKENKKMINLCIIIISAICIDQIVKFIITKNLYNSSITILNGILNFTYIENTGGAYGIGNGNIMMFIIVNIIIIALIIKFVISNKKEIYTHTLVSLGLIIAGGTSNLIDRIFRRFVVDYIDFSPLIKFPVFNIADICVVCGILIIIIFMIINNIKNDKRL